MNASELVTSFLKAQNLEQLGRTDEAVELYEQAVTHHFDSSGPYDRLIAVYSNQARHDDVVRVATSALHHVQTYDDKKAWYERMRAAAHEARSKVPRAAPRPE
jgi:tetratricopeptide (TPR) repeat protein